MRIRHKEEGKTKAPVKTYSLAWMALRWRRLICFKGVQWLLCEREDAGRCFHTEKVHRGDGLNQIQISWMGEQRVTIVTCRGSEVTGRGS